MRDWKPVTDKLCVFLALFMLKGVDQQFTLRSSFSKNSILATPVFVSVPSMDLFQSANLCISQIMRARPHIGAADRTHSFMTDRSTKKRGHKAEIDKLDRI
jgi:hypothetical protein